MDKWGQTTPEVALRPRGDKLPQRSFYAEVVLRKIHCNLRKDSSAFSEDIFVDLKAAVVMIDIRTFFRVRRAEEEIRAGGLFEVA